MSEDEIDQKIIDKQNQISKYRKFRVWDFTDKCFVNGALLNQSELGQNTVKACKVTGNLVDDMDIVPIRCCVVQHASGLKDKNMLDIFEGDILKLTFKDLNTIKNFYKDSPNTLLPLMLDLVKEDGTYTSIVNFDNVNIMSHFAYYAGFVPFWAFKSLVGSDDIEVVGNIFENPRTKLSQL